MVTCLRTKAKSTCGRGAGGADDDLTGGGTSSTLALAVVTTGCAGSACVWPTALSLLGLAAESATAGAAAGVCGGMSVGDSHAKWLSSKGRLVFQTANTRCSSLRMQCPSATSP